MIDLHQEPSGHLLMLSEFYSFNDCSLIIASFITWGEPSSVHKVGLNGVLEVHGDKAGLLYVDVILVGANGVYPIYCCVQWVFVDYNNLLGIGKGKSK